MVGVWDEECSSALVFYLSRLNRPELVGTWEIGRVG